MAPTKITRMDVKDVRFPTSLEKDGSDAMHETPDYSCAYVILATDSKESGHGHTFTAGRGTEVDCVSSANLTSQKLENILRLNLKSCITSDPDNGGKKQEQVCFAIKAMSSMVVGRKLADIFNNFGAYWRELTSEDQLRWIGPEKGVQHLACAAVVNALWDLWAKIEGKPLWKLLVDMGKLWSNRSYGALSVDLRIHNQREKCDPAISHTVDAEKLVNTIDFRYIQDLLTKEEAIEILKKMDATKEEREKEIMKTGHPLYTTSCGWLGYSDEKITKLATEAMAQGYKRFKMKVGSDLEDDIRRAKIFRKVIGYDKVWCVDANQKWEVQEAIDWMTALAPYKPLWIEEPTSPDDILGHATIAKALNPLGIGVATGEMCQNRVMFKQFMQADALQFCQIDACRLGGVNEILSVYLMAAKLKVPVCPHAGGVGLCELVQHYSFFDYIRCSGTLENRMTEYSDHLHEHICSPVTVENCSYKAPKTPGFLVGLEPKSVEDYEYPNGKMWQKMFDEGLFQRE